MLDNTLILKLPEHIELFLDIWVQRMSDAGYLRNTTAKREDSIQSFWGVLSPVLDYLKSNDNQPSFNQLLKNEGNWANTVIEFARSHRSRGISLEDFIGCFKTLIHSFEEIIMVMDSEAWKKLDNINILRRWSDGMINLILSDWTIMGQFEAIDRLAETNRELTLKKNKYENILEATSDLVLVTDPEGCVIEANTAAKVALKNINIVGRHFGDLLELGSQSIENLLSRFEVNQYHEIKLDRESLTFSFRIIPLQTVSLASRGYMILLSDISRLAVQRESLREEVSQYTTALADSEKQFVALFQNAGESILLLDDGFTVVESNQRSSKVFGLSYEQIIGISFFDLCNDNKLDDFRKAINGLSKGQNWEGELIGKRHDGSYFPMSIATSRIELKTGPVIQVLLKDITKRKELERSLLHEKNQAQEMNITLRNVLVSISDKNLEHRQKLINQVQKTILPALDRIEKETDHKLRERYIDIIKDHLLLLCGESQNENNLYLYKLSPTELKICQSVQNGSSTKEIAEMMGVSVDTIQTHRKNIRKKLGLRGSDKSLYNFLNSLTHTSPFSSEPP